VGRAAALGAALNMSDFNSAEDAAALISRLSNVQAKDLAESDYRDLFFLATYGVVFLRKAECELPPDAGSSRLPGLTTQQLPSVDALRRASSSVDKQIRSEFFKI
jgi:hypothetical protein